MAKAVPRGQFDRRSALDKAQSLVQQGKVQQAIEAYELVVRHEPEDWSSANTLGDLLVRAGETPRAIREYTRIADHLARAGFLARAGAIYKKVLRLNPTHVEALRETESIQVQRFAHASGASRQSQAASVTASPPDATPAEPPSDTSAA